MTTFQDARARVLAHARRELGDDPPLAVAPWGWEDARYFHLVVDLAANITDPDAPPGLMDAPMYALDKATGKVLDLAWPVALEARAKATVIGTPPE